MSVAVGELHRRRPDSDRLRDSGRCCADTEEIAVVSGRQQSRPRAGRHRERRRADHAARRRAERSGRGVSRHFRSRTAGITDLRAMCEVRTQSLSTILQRLEQTPQTAPRTSRRSTPCRASTRGRSSTRTSARWTRRSTAGRSAQQIAESRVPDAVRDDAGDARPRATSTSPRWTTACIAQPGELCLFPPRGNVAVSQTRASSRRRSQYFLKYLEEKPERPRSAVAAEPGVHDARAVSGRRAGSST